MKGDKKLTIADIAKAAKVSNATVSRVLSNSDYPVKIEVRQRVLEIVKELDYKPNIFSQMLKGGVSKEIGVIVPSISNPFYAQLVSAVEKECIKRGYIPIICSSYNSPKVENNHIEMMQGRRIAGILISTISTSDVFLNKLEEAEVPFVLFDQSIEAFGGSTVSFDFYKGGYMAAEYLLSQGNKKIVFASPPMDRRSRRLIYSGYKQALKDSSVRYNSKKVLLTDCAQEDDSGDYDYQNGVKLAEMLLESKYLPDAVLAVNDMIAIGIINTFAEHEIQVPSDISVMGFDNIAFSGMVTPALTTINQPAYETGELAACILLDRIQGIDLSTKQVQIEPVLVERKSVRKIHIKIRG